LQAADGVIAARVAMMPPDQEQPVTISLIVAAAENGVIGRGGELPWRIPSDLKTFRRLTLGKPVIMGRKTYQSIGRPLDGRLNIVVSRDPKLALPGVTVVSDLATAIAQAGDAPEIMIIGGAEIYRAALALAHRVYLTRVHAQPTGDATFELPYGQGWTLTSATPLPQAERDEFACTLQVFERQTRG
jgi:dihydrofolate reductase